MSRVHDALRRAEKTGALPPVAAQPSAETRSPAATLDAGMGLPGSNQAAPNLAASNLSSSNLAGLLELVE